MTTDRADGCGDLRCVRCERRDDPQRLRQPKPLLLVTARRPAIAGTRNLHAAVGDLSRAVVRPRIAIWPVQPGRCGRGEERDPVARPERQFWIRLTQTAIPQDRHRDAAGRPSHVTQQAADDRRVSSEYNLEHLVSRKRSRLWRWGCARLTLADHARGRRRELLCRRFS